MRIAGEASGGPRKLGDLEEDVVAAGDGGVVHVPGDGAFGAVPQEDVVAEAELHTAGLLGLLRHQQVVRLVLRHVDRVVEDLAVDHAAVAAHLERPGAVVHRQVVSDDEVLRASRAVLAVGTDQEEAALVVVRHVVLEHQPVGGVVDVVGHAVLGALPPVVELYWKTMLSLLAAHMPAFGESERMLKPSRLLRSTSELTVVIGAMPSPPMSRRVFPRMVSSLFGNHDAVHLAYQKRTSSGRWHQFDHT